MATTALSHLVRPMNLGDIPQIMEIEREAFPTAWPQTAFKRELQQNRLARYLVVVEPRAELAGRTQAAPPKEGIGLGRFLSSLKQTFSDQEPPLPPAESRAELIVGFVGIWLVADEAHIVTIAVRESHRGQGIGELLLISAITVAQENRLPVITLECRVSNTIAVNLYRKYGLKQVGLRPRYYSDNGEDAYVLSSDDIDSAAYREQFQTLAREHVQRWGRYGLQI